MVDNTPASQVMPARPLPPGTRFPFGADSFHQFGHHLTDNGSYYTQNDDDHNTCPSIERVHSRISIARETFRIDTILCKNVFSGSIFRRLKDSESGHGTFVAFAKNQLTFLPTQFQTLDPESFPSRFQAIALPSSSNRPQKGS